MSYPIDTTELPDDLDVDEPIDLYPADDQDDDEGLLDPYDELDLLINDLTQAEAEALREVVSEYLSAARRFPAFNSAHEGYAVLAEEVDELWDEVRAKQGARDPGALRSEAKQVSAMGFRFMVDVTAGDAAQR